MKKILVIQTAFIGDVVLATGVVEKLHAHFPKAKIDFLLRKGNEKLLEKHPFINEVIVWDKTNKKVINLIKIIKKTRSRKYDLLINIHRFASSGVITAFSRAKCKVGFDKNPLSAFYTKKIPHIIGNKDNYLHETDRNDALISDITNKDKPYIRLYPRERDYQVVEKYKKNPYICIAPTSVWFTKQYPAEKWVDFLNLVDEAFTIYLIGGPGDHESCKKIIKSTMNKKINNLCGELNFLESAALMEGAFMNFVNDSAPLHMASAVEAKVIAIFCSTVPYFGFGPLSSSSSIIETHKELSCRPCGLHGYRKCPEEHFHCAKTIKTEQLLEKLRLTDFNK